MMVRAASNPLRDTGQFRLGLPGQLDQRVLAIQFLISICRAVDLPLDVEHSLVSAFGEAFNNVVLHSYRDLDGDIEVEVETRRDRITVRLRDRGVGFDDGDRRAPGRDALPEGGLGLFIILRATDEARWYRDGDENVVELTKRIAG